MDQWNLTRTANDFPKQLDANSAPPPHFGQPPSSRLHSSHSEPRQKTEAEVKDQIAARKVQKADREKLRRDKLNEHFIELGHTLDPERPKNDKATILTDTIQVLKDLTAEVNRLKAECAALSEESSELTQEKNELREEKVSLKSDIDNLNLQYQQRLRVMFPWAVVDPSVVMPPPYSYPVAVPVPSGPIPMHPPLQPFPFFGNQNPGAVPNPCSTYIPYPTPPNCHIDRPSSLYATTSQVSIKQDSKSRSADRHRVSNDEKTDDSDDVATDLELKTPGSSSQQESSPGDSKGKQRISAEKCITDGSSSSRCSSSQALRDSSSSCAGDK